jgi:hypothetical protein
MSAIKNQNFDALLNVCHHIIDSEERALIDDVDRCMHEITVAACNYASAVRKLDGFRAERSARRMDETTRAGFNPF